MIISLKKEEIHTGNLILVNADYPILNSKKNPEEEKLLPVNKAYSEIVMKERAAVLLECILKDLGAEEQIVPVSAYRSVWEQERIYKDSFRENGAEFTAKYVAKPWCSEHQTGLAIDLGLKQETIDFICPKFPYEGICQLFREKAPEYGFIQRYRQGKENITGIGAEPWHFRYVGKPHAKIMKENGWVLEEYISFLRKFHQKEPLVTEDQAMYTEIFFVPAEQTDIKLSLPREAAFEISGNNVDGFIVTVRRNKNEQKKDL